MAKLQLALDGELATALEILQAVHPFIDIAEIGTPLVFREGMRAVRQIRSTYPDLCLIADLKIMDAGEAEADIALSAGADRATVMAVASNATIQGALRSARFHQGQIMIDMMQVEKPLDRAVELMQLGCELLCLHTAHDFAIPARFTLAAVGRIAPGTANTAACHCGWGEAGFAGADPPAATTGHHRRLRHHRRR